MSTPVSRRRWLGGAGLAAMTAGLTIPAGTPAQAGRDDLFFEETAAAFWEVPHQCADGTTVPGTLLVQTTRDFEAPETEDPDPTARLQFLAVCPDGTSFSWGAPTVSATIISAPNLKGVTASGSGIARDILGVAHEVSFDVTWTGTGPKETTVNGAGSKRQERTATAVGQVIFDGVAIADGPANHPTRPAPFIRVDIEK